MNVMLRFLENGEPGNAASITIYAANAETGDPIAGGNLLTISQQGVHFCASVNRDIGFELDGRRCLRNITPGQR